MLPVAAPVLALVLDHWIVRLALVPQTGTVHVPPVHMIEQRKLPHEFAVVQFDTYRETGMAIREMVVRGAGAIGATAGMAMAQAVAATAVPGNT